MGHLWSRAAALLALSGSLAVAASGAESTGAKVTFAKDVAPIFYKRCAECHRPGEIAPMSLLTYQDARPWAKAIKEKVLGGRASRRSHASHAQTRQGLYLHSRVSRWPF